MEKYFDRNGEKLRKGIYSFRTANDILYFGGEYNQRGEPIVENIEGNKFELSADSSGLLKRLNKEEIESKINWFEKGLSDR